MSNFLTFNPIIIIILIAVILRLFGLNWDQGYHLHPDERMIVMVTERISFPDQLNPKFFAYGSFPIYLLREFGDLASTLDPLLGSYDKINLVGRVLSAVFDIGTLLILYLLVRSLFNKTTALISSFFYAISVLPIQLSHFYAVDTPLTFFTTATLLSLVWYYHHPSPLRASLVGIFIGLGLATKTSALLLIIPVLTTFILQLKNHPVRILTTYYLLLVTCLLTTFFLTEPFAILDFPTFWQQTIEQQAMTKDAFTFPYTFQYVDKVPYLYELKNIFFWGLGPILAVLSFMGIATLTFYSLFQKKFILLILLAYFWTYFLIVGSFAIGFMRYMLPIYPILCLSAAFLLFQLTSALKQHLSRTILLLLTSYFFTLCLVWPLSFISIYTKDHTRVTATNWINSNIPSSALIAREHWDDELPLDNFGRYQTLELPMYEPDTPTKWDHVQSTLDQVDYIIISSNRLYVPLMKLVQCQKLPQHRCYQQTAEYYQKLLNNQLGFSKTAEFISYPKIPFTNLIVNDFDADESFTVYDHPKVMIFKKQ